MSDDNILVIGAGGYVGTSICENLAAAGKSVTGLARSPESAAQLQAKGYGAVEGNSEDPSSIADIADGFDATIICAALPFEDEANFLRALLDRYEGSGRAIIFTSGTAVLSIETPDGEWREESFCEDDPFVAPAWMQVRVDTENMFRSYASRDVRAMVIRPPLIWGRGASYQIPAIFDSIEKTGAACYRGLGLNLYSNVHVDDLAEIYRLALEKGQAGAIYHAVAGEANFRSLAEAAAQAMGCEARSVDTQEAVEIWGERFAPLFFGVSSRSRSPRTRAELGWKPQHSDVIEDIRNGSYKVRYAGEGE
ncbi:MAG: NAD-dependent epimerase/dehydratase family protein [Parasphingorhabdus sp.]